MDRLLTVEIEEHNSPRGLSYRQYKVIVDHGDRREYGGYIGYHDGAKFCAIQQYSPRQIDEIEKQLRELTKQQVPETNTAPVVPEELLKPQQEEEIDADELD